MSLTSDLAQFTGTEQYHFNPLYPKLKYTDGVKFFAQKAGAYWFLDIVGTELHPHSSKHPFMSINLIVEDSAASIEADDGNGGWLYDRFVEFTDCPAGKYRFFLIDGVFMLTSEY